MFPYPSVKFMFISEVNPASNRNEYQRFSVRGKDGLCLWLTPLPTLYVDCLEILGASTIWTPIGLSKPVQVQLYILRFILLAS